MAAVTAALLTDRTRLVFAQKLQNSHHLARYRLADLFLDTTPYGAHTTASDALWMAVPVLTWSGRSFASRVCGSLVRSAGLPELVVDSAHGHSGNVIETVREIKSRWDIDVIAGNVATEDGARDLVGAGADAMPAI